MDRPCHCGGEMQLEYFDPMKRPVEWFLRCRACGFISPCAPSPEAAAAVWSVAERDAA